MNGDITLEALRPCFKSNVTVHYFCCFRCVISPL